MLQMSSRLIASRSTGVCSVSLVAVGREERVQYDTVLGSGVGVVGRGNVTIIVDADRSAARIRLYAGVEKEIFLHLLLRCGEYRTVVTARA